MNEIEKLIQATKREHSREKSAAQFWIVVAVFANVIPLLLVAAIVLAFYFLK